MALSSGWAEDVLAFLHHVIHISVSLQPVDPQFDLSNQYLQSLMMIVAMALAIGFSMLVSLALFLCVVISFAPPVMGPTWLFRLVVIVCAIALATVSSFSVQGSDSMAKGIHLLLEAISSLQEQLTGLVQRHMDMGGAISTYNSTITDAAVCLGCFRDGNLSSLTNYTRQLCGHADILDPDWRFAATGGLLSAGSRANVHLAQFGALAAAGVRDAEHTIHVVTSSTTWHAWAAILPYYALTLTASGVTAGSILGRRSLLLFIQVRLLHLRACACFLFPKSVFPRPARDNSPIAPDTIFSLPPFPPRLPPLSAVASVRRRHHLVDDVRHHLGGSGHRGGLFRLLRHQSRWPLGPRDRHPRHERARAPRCGRRGQTLLHQPHGTLPHAGGVPRAKSRKRTPRCAGRGGVRHRIAPSRCGEPPRRVGVCRHRSPSRRRVRAGGEHSSGSWSPG